MGGSFAFTEAAVANTRGKDDAWNGAAGGCAAGFLAGIRGMSYLCTSLAGHSFSVCSTLPSCRRRFLCFHRWCSWSIRYCRVTNREEAGGA